MKKFHFAEFSVREVYKGTHFTVEAETLEEAKQKVERNIYKNFDETDTLEKGFNEIYDNIFGYKDPGWTKPFPHTKCLEDNTFLDRGEFKPQEKSYMRDTYSPNCENYEKE